MEGEEPCTQSTECIKGVATPAPGLCSIHGFIRARRANINHCLIDIGTEPASEKIQAVDFMCNVVPCYTSDPPLGAQIRCFPKIHTIYKLNGVSYDIRSVKAMVFTICEQTVVKRDFPIGVFS
jgi:hypothetical protein